MGTKLVTSTVEGSAPSDDTLQGTDPQAQAPAEPEATAPIIPVTDPSVLAAFEAKVAETIAFLESVGFTVRHGSAGAVRQAVVRDTTEKAEPAMVKAYFEKTGLSMAEIASAVGVTRSVISTVQLEKGDRWSLARFERAKVLIEDARRAKAAQLLADLAPAADPTPEPESTETTEQAAA